MIAVLIGLEEVVPRVVGLHLGLNHDGLIPHLLRSLLGKLAIKRRQKLLFPSLARYMADGGSFLTIAVQN